jgi:hypothetical protein
MKSNFQRALIWGTAFGIFTESCLIVAGMCGEWREDGPMSVGAAICFWPHFPGLLLGDLLGMLYPSSESLLLAALVTTFLATAMWFTIFYNTLELRHSTSGTERPNEHAA